MHKEEDSRGIPIHQWIGRNNNQDKVTESVLWPQLISRISMIRARDLEHVMGWATAQVQMARSFRSELLKHQTKIRIERIPSKARLGTKEKLLKVRCLTYRDQLILEVLSIGRLLLLFHNQEGLWRSLGKRTADRFPMTQLALTEARANRAAAPNPAHRWLQVVRFSEKAKVQSSVNKSASKQNKPYAPWDTTLAVLTMIHLYKGTEDKITSFQT